MSRPRLDKYLPVIDSLETRLRGVRFDNERFRVEIEKASEEMIRDREAKKLAEEKVEHLRTMIADRDLVIDSMLRLVKTKNVALQRIAVTSDVPDYVKEYARKELDKS